MRVILSSDYPHPPESDWAADDFASHCWDILLSDSGDYYHRVWGHSPTPLLLGPQPAAGGGDRW